MKELNACHYVQLIFDKGGKNKQWNKDNLFNKGVGKSVQVHAKKIRLDHQLTSYIRINSKWVKDLNVSCKTIKVLEEN